MTSLTGLKIQQMEGMIYGLKNTQCSTYGGPFIFLSGTHMLGKLISRMTHPQQFHPCIYNYTALYEYGQLVQCNIEALHCDKLLLPFMNSQTLLHKQPLTHFRGEDKQGQAEKHLQSILTGMKPGTLAQTAIDTYLKHTSNSKIHKILANQYKHLEAATS
jgi:hypothetical protein